MVRDAREGVDRDAPPFEAVELLPVGGLPDALAREITQRLSRRLHVPCRTRGRESRLVPLRLAHRDQVDADAFLRQVEELPRPARTVVVAVTDADMGHPIFTFFFGRARHHGPAAVVSTARLEQSFYGLPPDSGLTARRAVVEILHELGHVAGLRHCRDHACVMHFTSSVEALDLRGTTFCGACRVELPPALGG